MKGHNFVQCTKEFLLCFWQMQKIIPISTWDLHWNLYVWWMFLSIYTLHVVLQLALPKSSIWHFFIGLQELILLKEILPKPKVLELRVVKEKSRLMLFRLFSPEIRHSGRYLKDRGSSVRKAVGSLLCSVRAVPLWNVSCIRTLNEILLKIIFHLFKTNKKILLSSNSLSHKWETL